MNERIKIMRKKLNLTQGEFGELLGVGTSAVSKWERGTVDVPESTIKLMTKEFNINRLWLETGEGAMFEEVDDDIEELIDDILHGENEFHKNLFRTIAKLNKTQLDALESLIDLFSEVSEENKKG